MKPTIYIYIYIYICVCVYIYIYVWWMREFTGVCVYRYHHERKRRLVWERICCPRLGEYTPWLLRSIACLFYYCYLWLIYHPLKEVGKSLLWIVVDLNMSNEYSHRIMQDVVVASKLLKSHYISLSIVINKK